MGAKSSSSLEGSEAETWMANTDLVLGGVVLSSGLQFMVGFRG